MQMNRAFNAKMMTKLTVYRVSEGSYDDDNNWVEGRIKRSNIQGVLTAGNRFSQFDKGVAVQNEVGGIRHSEFKTLFVKNRFLLEVDDKIGHNGKYYNVLQMSDESIWGFREYLIEKSKGWTP